MKWCPVRAGFTPYIRWKGCQIKSVLAFDTCKEHANEWEKIQLFPGAYGGVRSLLTVQDAAITRSWRAF